MKLVKLTELFNWHFRRSAKGGSEIQLTFLACPKKMKLDQVDLGSGNYNDRFQNDL